MYRYLKDRADKNHLISESKSTGSGLIALKVVYLMSREKYIFVFKSCSFLC